MSEEFIRECFFDDLQDALFANELPEDLPPATEEEKKALFADFLTKTRSHFDTLPARTRKVAMQNLLGALPSLATVQEAMDAIMEAIDKCGTDAQKVLIVNKIGMVLDANGFESLAAAVEEEDCGCGHEHHHHHSHDCGCGHDHHHEHSHDCGCGHHHEH